MKTKLTGIELIAQERQEQFIKHGRTVEDDILHNNNFQLSEAASILCYSDPDDLNYDEDGTYDYSHCAPKDWDSLQWNKMMQKSYKQRLIIAGALIAAEIDRLNAIDY